jgi:tetratricopeptide (TPR) repeat protein
MSIDVYAPCPCGSGKKLKFCCHAIVTEMTRIRKLQQNHQALQALQLLDDLEKKHPGNTWILTTQATALLDEGKSVEAKQILDELLKLNPDHLLALALSAVVSFSSDGFESSKPAVHRAFQRCAAVFPDIISGIAMGIAAFMYSRKNYMAARQHLAITMRLAPEKDRQEIFLQLLKFDSNTEIPYPLRGVHTLKRFAPDDDEQLKESQKGARLSNSGCFALSARIFAKLTESNPNDAALWQNVGLCHAWGGHEVEAAKAFHKAAELHADYETAVECETLAQLLDLGISEDVLNVKSLQYGVESVGKLLTILDAHDRLVRVQLSQDEEDENTIQPAAIYNFLDRSFPADGSEESLTLETVPNVLAEISVFDHNPLEDEPARIFIIGFEGDNLQQSQDVIQQIGGEQITSSAEEESERLLETLPRDLLPLHWRWYFPPKTPAKIRKSLESQKWDHLVQNVWPNSQLTGIQGKTPLEASTEPALKVPLAAAVMVLDSYADRNQQILDASPLYKLLEIAAPSQLDLTSQTSWNTLSAMQMHRLPIADLNDEQLAGTLNRALLIHHSDYLYKVLTEILNRPVCVEKIDYNRAYLTLADLCRERSRNEEALHWIAKGRDLAESGENAFENVLQWKLREMIFRLDDPVESGDSELTSLLKHLWDYYGPKVPQLRTYLATIANTYGLKAPWEDGKSIVTPQTASETPAQDGIWTPDAQSDPAPDEGKKKLWLPGQD